MNALEQLAERIEQSGGGPIYVDYVAATAIREVIEERNRLRDALQQAIDYLTPRVAGGKVGIALMPILHAAMERTMLNGLTQAETEATPSCAGLSEYKWIEHKGNECPVHPRTVVHVRLRDGQESEQPQPAKEWFWEQLNDATISHYMIVK